MLDNTFQDSPTHEVATVPLSTEACLPRSNLITRDHRPSDLTLKKTNGLTTFTISELTSQISASSTKSCTAITQVPRHRSKRRPKTPIDMGNKPSSISGSPEIPDNSSVRSVVRRPVRVLRKSSTNLFQRINSKSPMLPPEVQCTAIQVSQQVSTSTFDASNNGNDESPVDPSADGPISSKSPGMAPMHSASTMTITEENTRPLSATTAIRDSRAESRRESRLENHPAFVEEFKSETQDQPVQQKSLPALPAKRDSALSPSIPAPSPLPEDSPHKYGLKDRMDTPEVIEPEMINVVKARRRSSGLDIFNVSHIVPDTRYKITDSLKEAKSLQSASSFLNGLSTSRRRAESTQRSTETSGWTSASYDTTRPHSARVSSRPSSRPSSTIPLNTFSGERRRGHSFKPSGFAYTRPLTMAQMKCYRNHVRLMKSGNKSAPVECSVCHIDDERDHFSCSWCALRMCRFCRQDFDERGITALKERIKQAELGGASPNSSTESLSAGVQRGRKAYL